MNTVSNSFISEDFLLHNKAASELYHQYAAKCHIVDYHNHLSPKDIVENRKFDNLTAAWLEGDHYKWRAMRIHGVAERFCTGDASPREKFMAWAGTVPYTLRNPLYHWTHLELKRYFNIDSLLDAHSAPDIYDHCNGLLAQDEFRVQALLRKMEVEIICTTDDPADTLEYHQHFAAQKTGLRMLPTFRPDKTYHFADPNLYNKYLDKLERVTGSTIHSFDDLLSALQNRVDYFDSLGCRASDHGLECLPFAQDSQTKAPELFRRIRSGNTLSQHEQQMLQAAILLELGRMYHAKKWAQQFHLGAMRNNNSRLFHKLGPDTGFDSIGDFAQARSLSAFLDELDRTDQLAKTILYNLNPADNEVFATMAGNFSDGSIPGKVQWGSAWWFLDQKDGMEKQINTLSHLGLLSRFVGMVTDSRSFLSFPRHEYFRRILCNLLGTDMEKGELPNDMSLIGALVRDICYNNVKKYFQF